MPMPTRRAIRPDGKYYRSSRRQRLARGSATTARSEKFWIILGATALAVFLFCFIRARVGGAGAWVGPTGWSAMVVCLICLAARWWQAGD
jgi:hypothetical protein